jgi:methyl-accepting chemotaxis protein
VLERLQSLQQHCAADLQKGLRLVATGDLTFEVVPVTPPLEDLGTDEIGQIAASVNAIRESTQDSVAAYNETRASLNGIIGEVAGAAKLLSASSQEMATTSDEAGRAIGEIAHAVSDVATGAERQARMADRTRESTKATGTAADHAYEISTQGAEAVTEADTAMNAVRDSSAAVATAMSELAEKSEQIGGIVETITGIAGQTNLLALNAAIEAARAGDQGRGFAVVADEVRKLAEESQQAAASISGLVGEIQAQTAAALTVVETGVRQTEDGAAVVARSREAFEAIGASIDEIRMSVGEIVEAAAEVASVSEQSSASAEQVSASTEQTSASTQQIAASAQELARSAEELDELVRHFTLIA